MRNHACAAEGIRSSASDVRARRCVVGECENLGGGEVIIRAAAILGRSRGAPRLRVRGTRSAALYARNRARYARNHARGGRNGVVVSAVTSADLERRYRDREM